MADLSPDAITAAMAGCPTPCDPDCEAPCHEAHDIPRKQAHNPGFQCGEVQRAIAEAVLQERERIRQQLAEYRFHDRCTLGDDCLEVYHCGPVLPGGSDG